MNRLIVFELKKIWGKPSFIFALCILLVIDLFLLWYTSLPNQVTPPLSSYKAFCKDIWSMSESEKAEYITSLKENIDGITFVQTIEGLQAMGTELGNVLAQQKLDSNPGMYQKYLAFYYGGDYLIYTDNFARESILIQELFAEFSTVSKYPEYLSSVQHNGNDLNGISIFNRADTFSTRNTRKSASDYENLDHNHIYWQPAKGIVTATESKSTDILLFLGVFLFVGSLITEEKEKGLLYITRATKYGILTSISAKLGALLLHCVAITILMTGANLLFAETTAGVSDLLGSIQSFAPYIQSNLSITMLEYIFLTILTKSAVFFGFGALITAVSIQSSKGFVPYLIGLAILMFSQCAYTFIPGTSAWNSLKYLNPIGLLETGELYGGYLNLDVFGYPVSRLVLSWITILTGAVVTTAACLLFFLGGENLTLKKAQISLPNFFRPHNNLMRHEAYKILIANRALLVLVCFVILLGYNGISQQYHLSSQEQYYQKLMLTLEGELDEAKKSLILSEQARFETAFDQIERIDTLVASGELDAAAADAMKLEWESILTLYPSFQRMQQQYKRIQQNSGTFVYDTGYLYLLGKMDGNYLVHFLLLSACVVLAFHNTISMEYRKKSLFLLRSTKYGYAAIYFRKALVCLICATIMTVLAWSFRVSCIWQTFPMHALTAPIRSIPAFSDFGWNIPIIGICAISLLSQILSVITVTLIILVISLWRKNDMQALFFGSLFLIIPSVLKLMGLELAGWFSLYPLYSWTA